MRNREVPSEGGVRTARAIAKACGVFASGGRELRLRPETIEALTAPAIPSRHGFFVAGAISEPGNYGFVERYTTSDGTGIPGGVGGGTDHDSHAIFYVGVPDVEAALQNAESLGGTRLSGPEKNPGADLVVGHFADPEGHVIGVAGPA